MKNPVYLAFLGLRRRDCCVVPVLAKVWAGCVLIGFILRLSRCLERGAELAHLERSQMERGDTWCDIWGDTQETKSS